MNTEQALLITQAKTGDPRAIAALIQQDLSRRGIEVCAWKKGRTLRLELLGSAYPSKKQVVQFLRHGLIFLQPETLDVAQVTVYVRGEDDPRWVERIVLRSPTETRPKALAQSWRQRLVLTMASFLALAIALMGMPLSLDALLTPAKGQAQEQEH